MKAAVRKSTVPDSRIFVIKYLDDQFFDPEWHQHAEFQLFVPLEGTGTRFIGDDVRYFNPHELILTGANLPHLWKSDEAYFNPQNKLRIRGIVIYMHELILNNPLMQKEEMRDLKALFERSLRGVEFFGAIKAKVIVLMKDMLKMNGLPALIQLLKILNLLAHSTDYAFISRQEYANRTIDPLAADRMRLVYDFIFKHYRSKIQLTDAANLLYLTPTSFSRYFKKVAGKSFMQLVIEVRIRHACQSLIQTPLSIANIARQMGFSTLSNFNKLFKEVMGETPSQYRSRHQ